MNVFEAAAMLMFVSAPVFLSRSIYRVYKSEFDECNKIGKNIIITLTILYSLFVFPTVYLILYHFVPVVFFVSVPSGAFGAVILVFLIIFLLPIGGYYYIKHKIALCDEKLKKNDEYNKRIDGFIKKQKK